MFRGKGRDLTWGVKESFRMYFERLPDHVYDLAGGAERTDSDEFRFPQRAEDSSAPDGYQALSFSGRLSLSAHFGALSVMIADPEVLLDRKGKATLSAAVDDDGSQPVRMVIADLAFEGMSGGPEAPRACFAAALASDGQFLFMGNYYAGDPLDPVTIRFAASPVP
jgi:Htaa